MNIKYISLTLALVLFTGCGGSSSSSSKKNDGKGEIDLAEYYPSKSMIKTFLTTRRDGEISNRSHYDQIVELLGQTITFTKDTKEVRKVVISDTNITTTEDGEVTSMYRHADIGDTLLTDTFKEVENTDLGKTTTEVVLKCNLLSKVEQFEQGDNKYAGDLLKIECISQGTSSIEVKSALVNVVNDDINGSHIIYDKSYIYLKKGLGIIANVNNDCVPNAKLPYVNDNEKECVKEQYENEFYIP